MIPLLSVTTINQVDSFQKFIKSIDYPIKTFSVLCNSYSFDYFLEIKKICNNSFVGEFIISYCPYNMGCSSSWNYHIKMNPECDYWIFSGDDVTLGKGDLERINTKSKLYDVTFSDITTKYSFFSLSKNCLRKVGFFDENIHPAYFEDDDYDRRIKHHNLSVGTFNFSGDHLGSGTIRNLTEDDRVKVNNFFEINKNYFHDKISRNDYTQGIFDFEERSKKLIKIK